MRAEISSDLVTGDDMEFGEGTFRATLTTRSSRLATRTRTIIDGSSIFGAATATRC